MKPSKRNLARQAIRDERKSTKPPKLSKFAAKRNAQLQGEAPLEA